MSTYLISDYHFDDEDAFCTYRDEQFPNLDDMNDHILDKWKKTVSKKDNVIFLGDLSNAEEYRKPETVLRRWLDELEINLSPSNENDDRSRLVFIRGNHDISRSRLKKIDFPARQHLVQEIRGTTYCFVHKPSKADDVSQSFDWIIHGHIHDDDLAEYPLLNQENNTINVSAELLNYRPMSFEKLEGLIRSAKSYQTIEDVP